MQTLSAKLSKLKCSLHQEHCQSIAAVCLSNNCNEKKRTLCSFCLLYNHQGHQIIELTQLGNMIKDGLKDYNQNVLNFTSICLEEMRNSLNLITEKIIQLSKNFKEIKKKIKETSSIELIYKQLFINSIKKEQELESIVSQLRILFVNNQFRQAPKEYHEQLFVQARQMSLGASFFLGSQTFNSNLQLSQQQQQIAKNCINNINQLFQQIQWNFKNDYSTIQTSQDLQLPKIDVSTQTIYLNYDNCQFQQNQKQLQLGQFIKFNLGLYLDLYENVLFSNGFIKVYEKYTIYPFSEDLLEKLRFDCEQDTIICIGGIKNTEKNKIILCAVDFAQEIFLITNESLKARKSQNADIYWYHFQSRCFGFSKNEKISASKSTADEYQTEGEYRFCVWLDGDIGFRIGNNKSLRCSNDYSYVIYMKL